MQIFDLSWIMPYVALDMYRTVRKFQLVMIKQIVEMVKRSQLDRKFDNDNEINFIAKWHTFRVQ